MSHECNYRQPLPPFESLKITDHDGDALSVEGSSERGLLVVTGACGGLTHLNKEDCAALIKALQALSARVFDEQ